MTLGAGHHDINCTITGLPWRRGSCLRADTVVSTSLWQEGHSITSHIRHPSVEEVGSALSHTSGISQWRGLGMRTALSHTSGISSWRRWALHYPTHRASACGGDGHCVLPHIGQALPGSGRLLCNGWVAPQGSSPHDHKRVLLCIHSSALQLVGGSHPGLPSRWEQVESAISVFNMVMWYLAPLSSLPG